MHLRKFLLFGGLTTVVVMFTVAAQLSSGALERSSPPSESTPTTAPPSPEQTIRSDEQGATSREPSLPVPDFSEPGEIADSTESAGSFTERAPELLSGNEQVSLPVSSQLEVLESQGLSIAPNDLEATISFGTPISVASYLGGSQKLDVEPDSFHLLLQLDEITPLVVRDVADIEDAIKRVSLILESDIDDDAGVIDRTWADLDVASEMLIYAVTLDYEATSQRSLELQRSTGDEILLHPNGQGHAILTAEAEQEAMQALDARQTEVAR